MKVLEHIKGWTVSKRVLWLIIIVGLVRLYGITNPPLEVKHNWRQTTVTMVARDFYEVDNNILYPRIDIAGDLTGITGMEFPVLNYTHYMVSLAFGYEHWYGRLINLIVSSIGVWFLFLLVKRFFNEKMGLYSALSVLLGSLWFIYSRKIMPDTFSTGLVLMGLYYALTFLYDHKKWTHALLYFLLTLLGLLAKIPSGYLLVLLAFPLLDRSIPLGRKILISGVTFVLLAPTVWWYFYWVPYITEFYGFWHFYMGASLLEGVKEIGGHFAVTLKRLSYGAVGVSGTLIMVFGIYAIIKNKQRALLIVTSSLLIPFLLFMCKAGFAFHHHDYYILPFIPMLSLLVGYGLVQIETNGKKWMLFAAIILMISENIIVQANDFTVKEKRSWALEIEAALDEVGCQSQERIAIDCEPVPTLMYAAHRKGWLLTADEVLSQDKIEEISRKGCKYLIVTSHLEVMEQGAFKNLHGDAVYIDEGGRFFIFKL
jgi:hypothetical protein